jgi:hypothetical protein
MEGGSSADVVAKAVIEAVSNENPSLRYLAGKDVETWIEYKGNMSDGVQNDETCIRPLNI